MSIKLVYKEGFPVWGTFLTMVGLGVLIFLGNWQLQRLAWKHQLLTELENTYLSEPLEIDQAVMAKKAQDGGKLFKGSTRGRYYFSSSVLVTPRTHEGKSGHHLVSAFKMDDGNFLFVNRGWVAPNFDLNSYKKQPLSGRIAPVTGMLKIPGKPGSLVADAVASEGFRYYIDTEKLANELGIENAAPYVLYAENEYKSPAIAEWQKELPPNNHMQYAITWFVLAFAMAIIYFLRFIRIEKKA